MLAGTFALFISMAVKNVAFLSVLGASSFFEWSCGVVSALAFSTGMFISMCGLLGQNNHRGKFLALHLIGLLIFCSMLSMYFLGYVVLSKIYYLPNDMPNILPQFSASAQMADSEKNRERMAQDAYKFFGVTLAYRRDNGELTYYQPTSQDIAFYHQLEKDGSNARESRSVLKDQLHQYPWLFCIYLGSFFVVYLAGTFWVMFRKSELRS